MDLEDSLVWSSFVNHLLLHNFVECLLGHYGHRCFTNIHFNHSGLPKEDQNSSSSSSSVLRALAPQKRILHILTSN